MPNLGPTEIILIVFVILVFFGAKKIPELAQGLGKGIREFKKVTREVEETRGDLVKTTEDAIGAKGLKDSVSGRSGNP